MEFISFTQAVELIQSADQKFVQANGFLAENAELALKFAGICETHHALFVFDGEELTETDFYRASLISLEKQGQHLLRMELLKLQVLLDMQV